jgi:hypothetical protein
MLTGCDYIIKPHIIKEKSELKSNELKRLWSAWDLAFERWEKELSLHEYRKCETYKLLEKGRNIAFTIIDNDGPYLKLVYQMVRAWEDVKEDDKWLK